MMDINLPQRKPQNGFGAPHSPEKTTGCSHFLIRAFVVETRKRNQKINWPFHFQNSEDLVKHEDLLPSMPVAEFRWWDCHDCLQTHTNAEELTAEKEVTAKRSASENEIRKNILHGKTNMPSDKIFDSHTLLHNFDGEGQTQTGISQDAIPDERREIGKCCSKVSEALNRLFVSVGGKNNATLRSYDGNTGKLDVSPTELEIFGKNSVEKRDGKPKSAIICKSCKKKNVMQKKSFKQRKRAHDGELMCPLPRKKHNIAKPKLNELDGGKPGLFRNSGLVGSRCKSQCPNLISFPGSNSYHKKSQKTRTLNDLMRTTEPVIVRNVSDNRPEGKMRQQDVTEFKDERTPLSGRTSKISGEIKAWKSNAKSKYTTLEDRYRKQLHEDKIVQKNVKSLKRKRDESNQFAYKDKPEKPKIEIKTKSARGTSSCQEIVQPVFIPCDRQRKKASKRNNTTKYSTKEVAHRHLHGRDVSSLLIKNHPGHSSHLWKLVRGFGRADTGAKISHDEFNPELSRFNEKGKRVISTPYHEFHMNCDNFRKFSQKAFSWIPQENMVSESGSAETTLAVSNLQRSSRDHQITFSGGVDEQLYGNANFSATHLPGLMDSGPGSGSSSCFSIHRDKIELLRHHGISYMYNYHHNWLTSTEASRRTSKTFMTKMLLNYVQSHHSHSTAEQHVYLGSNWVVPETSFLKPTTDDHNKSIWFRRSDCCQPYSSNSTLQIVEKVQDRVPQDYNRKEKNPSELTCTCQPELLRSNENMVPIEENNLTEFEKSSSTRRQTDLCVLNRNPADFTIPDESNESTSGCTDWRCKVNFLTESKSKIMKLTDLKRFLRSSYQIM